ncbi:MAG: NUDIX hydrolase [Acidimicrobiia bacterium]
MAPFDDDPSEWSQPDDGSDAEPVDDGGASMVGGERTIRAAGGVVWSRWGDGRLRILLIHRPRYDDWSLPKGKVVPGETDVACALREVREETGLACSVGRELPPTNYLDRKGRTKTVRYFAMQPVGGSFSAGDEVDQIWWLPVDEATRLLSYEHDAIVVAALAGSESAAS